MRDIERTPRDDNLHACPDDIGVKRGNRYLPRCRLHELCSWEDTAAYKASDRADAYLEPAHCFVHGDCHCTRQAWIERRNAPALTQFANTHYSPRLAVAGFRAHPIHRNCKFSVRPLADEFTNNLDRAWVLAFWITPFTPPSYTNFRMASTTPVNRHHSLMESLVKVDYDLLD
jgi:hypothetical protein